MPFGRPVSLAKRGVFKVIVTSSVLLFSGVSLAADDWQLDKDENDIQRVISSASNPTLIA